MRTQALAVFIATGLSLLFGLAMSIWYPDYKPSRFPALGWFFALGGFTFVLWFGLTLRLKDWQSLIDIGSENSDDLDALEEDAPGRLTSFMQRYGHRVSIAGLFLLVVCCIALLGWYTLPSGGTLRSPFAGALLAIALLSPFIAVQWYTAIVVAVAVLTAYASFSNFVFVGVSSNVAIPDGLTFLTTVVTTVVAVGIGVWVKFRSGRPRKKSPGVPGVIEAQGNTPSEATSD